MKQATRPLTNGWGERLSFGAGDRPMTQFLLWLVDAGLCGILCFAPFFFGGRHDLGRLVFVVLVAVTAVAWFARQSLLPDARWQRTAAHGIILLAAMLLVLQIIPFPAAWISRLSPRTADLLPMWSMDSGQPEAAGSATLGQWHTLSLTPHETNKSLAIFVAYALLFIVVVQRIADTADIRRLLGWIALSGVLMAGFGIAQFMASNGQFFWFYEVPFRTTSQYVTGSFINRNHFANFLVLSVGPLVAWLLYELAPATTVSSRRPAKLSKRNRVTALALVAALTLVIVAILWSLSRGGAIVLLVAATVLIAICLHRRIVDSRYAYGLMSLAIVVLGFLSLYGYEELAGRLDDFSEVTLDAMDHAGGRRTIWAANIAAIQAGWLVGAGAGSHSEITPVYLPESLTQEYTHAENGYLQVVTETGIFGAALAGLGIGVCGYWCYVCLRHTTKAEEVVCFVACAAGLATSAVHSAFDFVWYVPACMSVTVILAACTFRLAQAARPGAVDSSATPPSWSRVLSRSRWLELAAAVVLLGVWMIHTYFGPGMAAIHWDRYLRASVADGELSRQLLNRFISGEGTGSAEMRRSLSQIMLEELEQAVAWDSRFARAHARLADRMMAEFELRAADSANAMDVPQIRNAAEASEFASLQELRNWLAKAFGEDAELLPHALEHAHRAVSLCPLRGDSYLYLADLAFLEGASRSMVRAYIAQGLRVRPNDRKVLFRAGRQELLLGEPEAAIVHWSKCFNTPGIHQGQIVYGLVSSGMPATEFVARFNPDWYSLREIWNHYRDRGTKRDLDVLLHYAAQMTRQSIDPNDSLRPESVWYWLASMYADVGRAADSLACLERAYMCDSRQFHIRYALGKALLNAGRHREAEPHVRWCLARRPAEESLDAALATIARKRYAERSQTESRVRQVSATLVR